MNPPPLEGARFDGEAYDPALDQDRLTKQLGRVWDAMKDGEWLTLVEIGQLSDAPEESVSAQLRHLRKPRFGAYLIEKRRRGDPRSGLWEYKMAQPSRSKT